MAVFFFLNASPPCSRKRSPPSSLAVVCLQQYAVDERGWDCCLFMECASSVIRGSSSFSFSQFSGSSLVSRALCSLHSVYGALSVGFAFLRAPARFVFSQAASSCLHRPFLLQFSQFSAVIRLKFGVSCLSSLTLHSFPRRSIPIAYGVACVRVAFVLFVFFATASSWLPSFSSALLPSFSHAPPDCTCAVVHLRTTCPVWPLRAKSSSVTSCLWLCAPSVDHRAGEAYLSSRKPMRNSENFFFVACPFVTPARGSLFLQSLPSHDLEELCLRPNQSRSHSALKHTEKSLR